MKFKVSVAFVKGQYIHDRFIFTNYFFIDAGKGFNLYNKFGSVDSLKPNKETLKFLFGPDTFKEFEDAVKNYCNVVFNTKTLIKLERSLDSIEIFSSFEKTV